jgi:hypothetical protein
MPDQEDCLQLLTNPSRFVLFSIVFRDPRPHFTTAIGLYYAMRYPRGGLSPLGRISLTSLEYPCTDANGVVLTITTQAHPPNNLSSSLIALISRSDISPNVVTF